MPETDQPRDLAGDGFAAEEVPPGGMLSGQVDGVDVVVVRTAAGLRALAATCTHYGGPLAEGAFDGSCLRCPWHHARFDVETGRADAPAYEPVTVYRVEEGRDGRVRVPGPAEVPAVAATPPVQEPPGPVVVVGGGDAAFFLAHRLRTRGSQVPVVLLCDDERLPYDRITVSKDYLDGTSGPDQLPLVAQDWYAEHAVEVRLRTTVTELDTAGQRVLLAGGRVVPYGTLVLAPGAEPQRPPAPGADLPFVHTLRSVADTDAVVAGLSGGDRAVVVGASFIGLEAAASLRARGLQVDVVAPEAVPLAAAVGEELGGRLRALHEEQGVVFHLGRRLQSVAAGEDGGGGGGAAGPAGDGTAVGRSVTLDDGTVLGADLVVLGIGVSPRTELAEAAGMPVDDGVLVDDRLRVQGSTDVYALGDVARFPWRGGTARVEHWTHAGRTGQAAADILLGDDRVFDDVPFFWSEQYGVGLRMAGFAPSFDRTLLVGDPASDAATTLLMSGTQVLAVASLSRETENVEAEVALGRDDQEWLRALAGPAAG